MVESGAGRGDQAAVLVLKLQRGDDDEPPAVDGDSAVKS
jgi:hypothetical protein